MVDYWKDVPGIDDLSEGFSNGDKVQFTAGDAKGKVGKVIKDDGKWITVATPSGEVKAKADTIKKISDAEFKKAKSSRAKGGSLAQAKRRALSEAAGVDSSYLQRSLDILADDFKRGEKEEKALVPILRHIESRLNQSFPDGDVSSADIEDLLKEVAARKAVKKSGMSIPDLVDMIMDVQ